MTSHSKGSGHSALCAYAQTRQSLLCSHTQSMNIDKDSDQTLDLKLRWIRQQRRLLKSYTHMGTCLRGFHQSEFQTGLLSYRD